MTSDREYRKILENSNFIKMIAANEKLTVKAKISALKNRIRKERC